MLLFWRAWLLSFQRIPARVGGWDSRISRENVGGENLHDPLEMEAERSGATAESLLKSWGETGRLDLEEPRKR